MASIGLHFRSIVTVFATRQSSNAYATGYYTQGAEVSYAAITAEPREAVPLFSYDLKFKNDRVSNLVLLIRLSAVLTWMRKQLPSSPMPQYAAIPRYVPSSLFVYWGYQTIWTEKEAMS